MPKFPKKNACAVSVTHPVPLIYIGTLYFIVSDFTLFIIYRRLVKYVHEVSSGVQLTRQQQKRRDLKLVHRVVLLNSPSGLVGVPSFVIFIINMIRLDLSPNKLLSFLMVIATIIICFIITSLFWSIPKLRHSLIRTVNKVRRHLPNSSNRVIPITNSIRFKKMILLTYFIKFSISHEHIK